MAEVTSADIELKNVEEGRASSSGGYKLSTAELVQVMSGRFKKGPATVKSWGGVPGMLEKLNTSKNGVELNTLQERRDLYGENDIRRAKLQSYCSLVIDAAQDAVMAMLMASAFIQLLLGYIPATANSCHGPEVAWVEPFVILVAVVIVTQVAASTDYAKQAKLSEMQDEARKQDKLTVKRADNAAGYQVEKVEIVVGDIVKLGVGDVVPADGYYIQGADLEIDEASLTGEPEPVKKGAKDPWLLSGTKVLRGQGDILILAVGEKSVQGKIQMNVLFGSETGEVEEDSEPFTCFGLCTPVDEEVVEETSDGVKVYKYHKCTVKRVTGTGELAVYDVEFAEDEINKEGKFTHGVTIRMIKGFTMQDTINQTEEEASAETPTYNEGDEVEIILHRETVAVTEQAGVLESKLDTMALRIGAAGGYLAGISGVIALIIWAVLKFATGNIIQLKEVDHHGHPTGVTIKDASFFAVPDCADPSLVIPNQTVGDCKAGDPSTDPQKVVKVFVTAVTILVVAIPEGLPLAVTLAIAFAQNKLYKENNFVKLLDACETMGSATTICSDKTGTLTQNRMTVTEVYLAGKVVKASKDQTCGQVVDGDASIGKPLQKLVCESISINTDDKSFLSFNKETKRENDQQNGNKTECAMLGFVMGLGGDYAAIRKDGAFFANDDTKPYGRDNPPKFPFSSERKRMSTLVPIQGQDDMLRVHTKGASEVILARCNRIIDASGDPSVTHEISSEQRGDILKKINDFADGGFRTLCLAYRDIKKDFDLGAVHSKIDDSSDDSSPTAPDYEVEHDLVLIGILAIQDPLRVEVPEAINKCFDGGVDVRMVTGDNIRTAISIATSCGILREEHYNHVPTEEMLKNKFESYTSRLMNFEPIRKITAQMKKEKVSANDIDVFLSECKKARQLEDGTTDPVKVLRKDFAMIGENFAARVHYGRAPNGDKGLAPSKSYGTPVPYGTVNQEELDKIWPRLRVMARCQPEDKLVLVNGLMESDVFMRQELLDGFSTEGIKIYPDHQVVAVTGDGTNDAPALKRANVGFAMGIQGTQVAKDACDIILMDDNFASIVTAMKWGRNIYDSIQKFIQFQLTVNIVACAVAAIGALIFQESPLGAIQMLWVNLVMDSLASLALATEPPTEALLTRPPYGRRENIIKRGMYINMFGQAFYQLIVVFIILFNGHVAFYDKDGQVAGSEDMKIQKRLFPDANNQLKIGWFSGCDSSQHYTMLFNAFVVMTLFNQVPARKLKGEMNIFGGILNNPYFCTLLFLESLGQVLFTQFGGNIFGVYGGGKDNSPHSGLTGGQWLYCILFGFIGWFWQLVLNYIKIQTEPEAVTEGPPRAVREGSMEPTRRSSGTKRRSSKLAQQNSSSGQKALDDRVRKASAGSEDALGLSDQ